MESLVENAIWVQNKKHSEISIIFVGTLTVLYVNTYQSCIFVIACKFQITYSDVDRDLKMSDDSDEEGTSLSLTSFLFGNINK